MKKKLNKRFLKSFLNICVVLGLTLLLSEISSFAAEKVYFYHTDATGTPLVMTDENGTVVWEADYKPFGEEQEVTPSPENNKMFVGKEKDHESGLYYFGARYMDAGIGRFTTPDPKGISEADLLNPQRLNRYSYSLNNPYRYVDLDGRWPTKVKRVHRASINRVIPHISERDRNILSEQQITMDTDQSSAGAYRHSMRSPNQSPDQAWERTNKSIRQELSIARELENKGQHEEALRHLGNAMHTMQDSTSPAHRGFQEWDEHSSFRSKAGHVKQEFFDPGTNSALDAATQRTWDTFKSNEPIPKEMIPRP